MYNTHKANCTNHDNAKTPITACKSRLNTNNTKILQPTLTNNDIKSIANLCFIFQSHAKR